MSASRPARTQAGLSIMELMIAMAIGLFLLVGLVTVFASSNRTYLELNRASQQIENGRFAIQILSDDIALAGYYGRYAQSLAAPAALLSPCETDPAATSGGTLVIRGGTPFPIQGYDAQSGNPASWADPVSCLSDANHVDGTDVLVVRRADTSVTASASLTAQEIYVQTNSDTTNSNNPVIALGNAANFPLLDKDSLTQSAIRKYHVHVYFIAPCSIPNGGGTVCTGSADDAGRPIPTLKRMELSVDPSDGVRKMRIVPLVEGIENMQIDYGVDSDADGVPNGNYLTAPATVADWANVVAIRVNLLARNTEASAGYTDSKVYDMGIAGTVSPGDSYKRHVYNAVIRVVNPGARRES